MELEYRKLSEDELASGLADLPGWAIENEQISKAFEFKSYLDGIAFTSAVGYLAERLDHHPT